MSRAPAPTGRARLLIPTPVTVSTLLLGLAVSLTGCGADQTDKSGKTTASPSKQAVACRKDWKELDLKVAFHDSASPPSVLAPRWNTIAATIDYYATSASGTDCGTTLTAQEKAITALTTFSKRLERYDMELRLEQVKPEAVAYVAGPRPADVAAALKTLSSQAPRATQQQAPGWQQARVTELSDKSAVKKTVKDLSFLSRESKAYRSCASALGQITKALRAKTS